MKSLSDYAQELDLKAFDNRFMLWEHFVRQVEATTLAEIGVWKGDFAAHQLRTNSSIQSYYMVDPWSQLVDWNKPANVTSERFEKIYQEAMSKTQFASDKVRILRGRTKDVIDQIPDESLDFVYIDGDHTLRGITIDLIKIAPKMREGGFICGDDFSPSPWQHSASYDPTLVFPQVVYFAEAMDFQIISLPFNQFAMQRDRSATFKFIDLVGEYDDLSLKAFGKGPPRLSDLGRKLKKALKLS